ncbi:MAG: hypothetical protein ABSB35_25120 [Bryobacteraceae bacterium]
MILDREQQALTIRRSLFGIGWTHQYGIEEIEEVFEYEAPRERDKRLLAIELTSGRTRRLTLWAKRPSLSAEQAQLNEALKRFRRSEARKTGRVHKPLTEDKKWAHTKENASVDLRRHLRRTLYALVGFVTAVAAVVPFLYGHVLYEYREGIGKYFLLASLVLWIVLVVEAALSFIDWENVRNLEKIDKQWHLPKK